jgi:hypothetical protein
LRFAHGTPLKVTSFGKCHDCDQLSIVKYNGVPLCLDCWDRTMRMTREKFIELGLDRPAHA